jgi:putative transposase
MFEKVSIMSEYIRSNKVVYLIQYHVIWCPKYRKNILVGDIKDRLIEIINDISGEQQLTIKALEIMPNHVHVFFSMSYLNPSYKIIKLFKGRSSHILREEFPELKKMPSLWTRSFFVSSIGNVSEKTIKKYIEDQCKKKP